jgi:hypothetical protein
MVTTQIKQPQRSELANSLDQHADRFLISRIIPKQIMQHLHILWNGAKVEQATTVDSQSNAQHRFKYSFNEEEAVLNAFPLSIGHSYSMTRQCVPLNDLTIRENKGCFGSKKKEAGQKKSVLQAIRSEIWSQKRPEHMPKTKQKK